VGFIVRMTVEQLQIGELVVLSISVLVMHFQQVIGAKAKAALTTSVLLSLQQENDSGRASDA
jgi:hypothetical protein